MTATVALERAGRERRGQIYVALAAVAWSTAGVLQRQLTLDTPTQVLGRAVFAAAALLVYVAVVDRGRVRDAFRSVGLAGVAVALCVAVASGALHRRAQPHERGACAVHPGRRPRARGRCSPAWRSASRSRAAASPRWRSRWRASR